ncbi:MAG: hypothetical protein WB245_06015 [Acidimicrobiia bacterium]
MELNRLSRVLRDRWILIVVMALLGFLAGWYFTGVSNERRGNEVEAVIAIRFEPQEGEVISDVNDRIQSVLDAATFAAGDLLLDNPTSSIEIDPTSTEVRFTAVGNSEAEAAAKAKELLDAYKAIDPRIDPDVDAQLAEVLSSARQLDEQIQAIQDSQAPASEDLVARHNFLDQQIQAFTGTLVQLRVQAVTAPTQAERDTIRQNITDLETALRGLTMEKAALPPIDTPQLSVTDQFQLTTLENARTLLLNKYETLFLRKLGVTQFGNIQDPEFNNLSEQAPDPVLNGFIGLIGGLLLAIFAIVFITRARKPVWLPEDVDLPVVADVPTRRVAANVAEAWYDADQGSPRKIAIQALRAVVEAQLPATGGTLAIAGDNVPSQNLHALAVDLAVSMASAGASVLLIDADFVSDSALGEYVVGGPALSEVLKLNPDSPAFNLEMDTVLQSAIPIRHGLGVIPTGPRMQSPGDALAGRQFRAFIERASNQFDVVMVSAGDISSTGAQVTMQRIMRSLLVLSPGRSTIPQVNALLADVRQRQVSMLGAVFLQKSERASSTRRDRPEEPAWAAPSAGNGQVVVPQSPLRRLTQYSPVKDDTPPVPQKSLRDLADRMQPAQDQALASEEDFGAELLTALAGARPNDAYEAVADYLVTRVEDLMSAPKGESDYSDELVGLIASDGFLPLQSTPERPSVGMWLAQELNRELEPATARAMVHEIERVLGTKSARGVQTIDEWLGEQFFRRHLNRTKGEPFVWQIQSEGGTCQILAAADWFNRDKIETLLGGLTRRVIEELDRNERAAQTRGDVEQAAILETRIADVQDFEARLGLLIGLSLNSSSATGSKKTKKISEWVPDPGLSRRANLAVFQGAGLLPFQVLTDEEMSSTPVRSR